MRLTKKRTRTMKRKTIKGGYVWREKQRKKPVGRGTRKTKK